MSATSVGLLTVPQVCAQLPGKGSLRVHPSTVTRWILAGCPDRAGRRVKLHALRVGGRWLINPADLDAFFAALAGVPPAPAPDPARSPAARQQAAAAAAEQFKRMGA